MNNRIHFSLPGLAVLALAGCGENCRHKPAPAAPAAVAAATLKLTRSDAGTADILAATVRAARSATLAPRIPGTYAELKVAEGDTVKRGDLLAVIHAPEWEARASAARAALALAKADHARLVKLRAADAATAAEFDASLARLEAAESGVAESAAMLAETRLTAPHDGFVSRKYVNAGAPALPGTPTLTIEDPTSLELEVAVPESGIDDFKLGDRLRADIAGKSLAPRITEIAPAADAASRTRMLRARLTPGDWQNLTTRPAPGTAATVMRPARPDAPPVIYAPTDALMRRGQVESVWVKADGKATLRLVRTGRTMGATVEILSGLSGAETLLAPAADVVEGVPVK